MLSAKLNGLYDLGLEAQIRPYIGTVVEIVKQTKAGLYQIKTHDGKLFSVPKRNLDPI
jgi:hypothetical protein